MRTKLFYPTIILLICFFSLIIKSYGQTSEIKVGKISWNKVDIKGFNLAEKATIKITGYGALYDRWENNDFAYGWILNSDNRKVVWSLIEDRNYDGEDGFFDFKKELTLEKGNYEVYYTKGGNNYNNNDDYDFGDLLKDIFNPGHRRTLRKNDSKLYMTISGPSKIFNPNNGTEVVDQTAKNAIVSIIRTGDDEYVKKGFTLNGDTKIHIYAIGEGRNSRTYDYCWIYNIKTNKRVWALDSELADNAGGGEKNISAEQDIVLPAGSYMVYYVTDDSHSFERWNVMPPSDPQFWGITISAVSKDDLTKVKPLREEDAVKPIVELTKVRDDEYLSKGFTLEEPMDLRILCLGESDGSDMADYGWIINADTREEIWRMKRHDTEHAGGAEKNRMIDETAHLNKGSYIVHYSTDDSHSYNDWNDDSPFDGTRWGITIWTVNEKDLKKVKTFEEDNYKSKDIIARIIRVRDDEHIKKSFSLDKDTKVRILAIGEGTRSSMVDYGWIKNNDTRKVVWEMTYRNSEHAGGSQKNRIYNNTIILTKGNYTFYYETDDSHSYRDWNDSPPRDSEMYVITLYYD